MVGVAAVTMTDWVPAVVPSLHTTITVYVPGPTFAQEADCVVLVPVRVT